MLSIILPTYNEKDNIRVIVNGILDVCKKNKISNEIIIVDDNSPDGTGKIADDLSKKYNNLKVIHREKKSGLGSAVLAGFSNSKGKFICIMDADLQHNPDDLPKLYSAVQTNKIVLGSRYVSGGGSDLSFMRNLISRGATLLSKIILGVNVKDPMSGFSMISRDIFEKTKLDPRGFKINIELIYKSKENVKEVPITIRKRVSGETKLGFSEFLDYFRLMLELRLKR